MKSCLPCWEPLTAATASRPSACLTCAAKCRCTKAVATAIATATAPASSVQLGAAAGGDKMYTTSLAGLTPFVMTPAAISNTGGSLPHDNTMPTLTVSFCIAWAGIFPSQS